MTKIVASALLICGLHHMVAAQVNDMSWTSKTGAKKFSFPGKIFNTADYGAVNDTNVINTNCIQKTIDACAAKGGGIVIFKPGMYVTGSLFIKANVQLRIDKDVTILGSQNFDDYPEIDTRIAGIEMKWPAALINIIDVKKNYDKYLKSLKLLFISTSVI